MFLKRLHRRKGKGKQHTYWALVESVRTAKGSRHRTVAYLGTLAKDGQSGWAQLGGRLSKKRRPPPSLFDPPRLDEPGDDEPVPVKLSGVALERLRDFGGVWLGLGLWRLLELDKLLAGLMPAGREDVAWPVMASILTIARLCEPSSELHIADTWYRRTALDDLLGVPADKIHHRRLYAALDQLLAHKEAIEQHLKGRLGDLFDLDYELLLYDVTSTYFEGQCEANPMAQRGYSRDGRPDCLQVCIGLVVTTDGMPLGYEVFDGNKHDSKTVQSIVDDMEAKYGRANRIWVMDRGMVSEENLKYLRARHGSYIVGTPKAMLRQFEQHLVDKQWHEVQAGVEVKLVPGPDADETFILARSADRREKERAMHQRFIERMESGLQKLKAAIESGRLKDPGIAHERLGRLRQQCQRSSRAFDVQIQQDEQTSDQASLSMTWSRNERWHDWMAICEGCYLLRTNLTQNDPAMLWKQYMQLTDAEWAFRIHKDELVIRPIWHQKEKRVRAHILVCFLAYVLWKTLAQWMQRSGLGDAPRTVLEEFDKIKSGDVILPARQTDGTTRTLRLRCVTTADEPQKVLLSRLGLTLPRRLRRIDEIPQM
jgi:transposase